MKIWKRVPAMAVMGILLQRHRVITKTKFQVPIRGCEFMRRSFPFSTRSRAKHCQGIFQTGKTHYEILDVRRTASPEEIRNAFLKLSKQFHPDINKDPDNHKQFVLINEAYSILNKPLSRRDYDFSLDAQRHLNRQQNSHAYRSHGYGYTGDSGHYYHHRSYVHEEGFSQEFNSGRRLHNVLVNFYSVTAFLTVAIVALILQIMYIVYPSKKSFIHGSDVDKHELIMTSVHDGRTVFYYAKPNDRDPLKYEIIAVAKKEHDEESEELEQLHDSRSLR